MWRQLGWSWFWLWWRLWQSRQLFLAFLNQLACLGKWKRPKHLFQVPFTGQICGLALIFIQFAWISSVVK
jgi:hypothetical protein